MVQKIDELNNPPKDPNSQEAQEFLRKLHKEITEANERFRKVIEEWKVEDRRNEAK